MFPTEQTKFALGSIFVGEHVLFGAHSLTAIAPSRKTIPQRQLSHDLDQAVPWPFPLLLHETLCSYLIYCTDLKCCSVHLHMVTYGLLTAQSFAPPAFLLPLDIAEQRTCTGHRDVSKEISWPV